MRNGSPARWFPQCTKFALKQPAISDPTDCARQKSAEKQKVPGLFEHVAVSVSPFLAIQNRFLWDDAKASPAP
jgi:hypothetical protein